MNINDLIRQNEMYIKLRYSIKYKFINLMFLIQNKEKSFL